MPSRFSHYPTRPTCGSCEKAYTILCNTHGTASSFLHIFETTRRNRSARGTPTDEEQDLLRAMLTFASGGLDSLVKQLISDALPSVIESDEGAFKQFKTFIQRRIKKGDEFDHGMMADLFSSPSPRDRLIQERQYELTSDSLQSVESLLTAGASFGIPSNDLCHDLEALKRVFLVRNQIIHEMDVDFDQPNRNRRPRGRESMIEMTNILFKVSKSFLKAVDDKIVASG